jgi:hypothetical protein
MTDIVFSPQNNMGGVCLLSVVPTFGLTFDPSSVGSSILASGIGFKAGFRWFGLYGTEGTKQFAESGKNDDNGGYYEPKVRCFVPGDAQIHRAQFEEWLQDYPLLIKVEDANASLRLVGTVAEPMRLTELLFDTTDSYSGRRGTSLTFTSQTRRSAMYLL